MTGNLPEEKKERLEKARKRIDLVNRARLAFLFIAVVFLVFIYFGNKIWEGTGWYDSLVTGFYSFLLWDILFMFTATVAKLILAIRYNKMVKGL